MTTAPHWLELTIVISVCGLALAALLMSHFGHLQARGSWRQRMGAVGAVMQVAVVIWIPAAVAIAFGLYWLLTHF
jgi:hypothetical protein